MSDIKALFLATMWGLGVLLALLIFMGILMGLTYIAEQFGIQDYFIIGMMVFSAGMIILGVGTSAYKFYKIPTEGK